MPKNGDVIASAATDAEEAAMAYRAAQHSVAMADVKVVQAQSRFAETKHC